MYVMGSEQIHKFTLCLALSFLTFPYHFYVLFWYVYSIHSYRVDIKPGNLHWIVNSSCSHVAIVSHTIKDIEQNALGWLIMVCEWNRFSFILFSPPAVVIVVAFVARFFALFRRECCLILSLALYDIKSVIR